MERRGKRAAFYRPASWISESCPCEREGILQCHQDQTTFLSSSRSFLEIFLVWESGFWKSFSESPCDFGSEVNWSLVWMSLERGGILQIHQDDQSLNFPDRFQEFSWDFPGLKIWFLDSLCKELSFHVRILIRHHRSWSLEPSARRRIHDC